MSKKVKSVEITFENLDYVDIPAAYFGAFEISGIRSCVKRLACNVILQRSKADLIEFELLRSADIAFHEFEQDLFYDPLAEFSLLDRIRERGDITALALHYYDGTTEQFYVPWEDADDEYHNKLQLAHINNNGNLHVTIKLN